MRKTCPYCKQMMVSTFRFSKDRCDYLMRCKRCHYEVKANNLSPKDNASICYHTIIGVTNAST